MDLQDGLVRSSSRAIFDAPSAGWRSLLLFRGCQCRKHVVNHVPRNVVRSVRSEITCWGVEAMVAAYDLSAAGFGGCLRSVCGCQDSWIRNHTIRIVIPPSMVTVSPVTKSFVTNSVINVATSSGVPSRCSGIRLARLCCLASSVMPS